MKGEYYYFLNNNIPRISQLETFRIIYSLVAMLAEEGSNYIAVHKINFRAEN